MTHHGPARVLLSAGHEPRLVELRLLLEAQGHHVALHPFDAGDPADLDGLALAILDGTDHVTLALDLCRRLRARLEEQFLPVLFISDKADPHARLACFEAGADTYLLRPFASGELVAQVRALVRIKQTHDRLAEKTGELSRVNRRLQQAYQQIDQELELAQRLQASFLPQSLPQVPHVRFAVHYLLCGRVGGDFYDTFRLDERHVGFYVADAMGHGVPASLLTVFVKKGVRAKEVFGNQYRLLPPDEVLGRLNRDLIDQQLSEQPFITIVYALLNNDDGSVQVARAGHPYPLYVPRQGEPVLWKQEGMLLGVAESRFPTKTYHLRPGDKLILYTDGVDQAELAGHEPGVDSLMACAARHRHLPVQELVARLARDLFVPGTVVDDLTLFALERVEE